MENYDMIVIGFGNGGKTIATSFAFAGKKVALIERSQKMFGGSCPNVGCIPTKFLVERSDVAEKSDFRTFSAKAAFYERAIKDKNATRAKLDEMLGGAMVKNPNITLYNGFASFISGNQIRISTDAGDYCISGDKIVIDTGSRPLAPRIDGLEQSRHVYFSESMLDNTILPETLVIIGGGNIGLEFASIYSKFGSEVTVLQDKNEFYPEEEPEIVSMILETLKKRGIKFEFGVNVTSIKDDFRGTTVTYETGGLKTSISCDTVLVATGRIPNTQELNAEVAGVEVLPNGAIKTDEHLRTTAPGIWAIGDVVGGKQFTYISKDDARVVLSHINGGNRTKNDRIIPYSVFLSPTFSKVGLTEQEARTRGYNVKTSTLSTKAISRCHATGQYTGLLKAVVDGNTGMILGASLYCDQSHEIINYVSLAMAQNLSYTVLRDHIFTHPIMSEALNDLFERIK